MEADRHENTGTVGSQRRARHCAIRRRALTRPGGPRVVCPACAVAPGSRDRQPRPTPPTHLHTVFGTAPHAPLAHPVPHQKAKVWGAKWVRAVGADICAARRRALTRPGGTHVDGLAYAVVSGGRGMTRQGSSYFPELAPGEEIESLPRES